MSEAKKLNKHPDAIAWDEWFGKRPAIGYSSTLGTTKRADEYLKDRLEMAWQAGIEHGRRTPEAK